MISFLSGTIILKKEKYAVLDVNGVGYKVYLSHKTLTKIPEKGQKLNLFCHLQVREDLLDLYGFLNEKELEFFEILEEIRGVGPKVALEISSLGSLETLKESILKQDARVFESIPGIGKKRAMTIILELTGRIKDMGKSKEQNEEIQALANLGFSKQEAKAALEKVSKDKEPEERIKEALKILGKA